MIKIQDYLLNVTGLTKHFGGVKALTDLDIQIIKGEIHALIGPNGAGKTTTINVLTGVLPATSGKIEFLGRDITRSSPHQVAAMGMTRTYQAGRLFERLTVLENVMVGGHTRTLSGFLATVTGTRRFWEAENSLRDDAISVLESLGLGDAVTMPVTALSYGQRRLVEIARAMMAKPKLLLLDEPAAGLNSAEVEDLIKMLQNLRQRDLTILLIEHNMGMVMRLADRISVLNFGRKIAVGTPAEIRSNEAVIEAYLGKGYRDVAL